MIDDDLGLSNGLAWSPDGNSFYSIDTAAQVVWVRSYDVDSGQCGGKLEDPFLKLGRRGLGNLLVRGWT